MGTVRIEAEHHGRSDKPQSNALMGSTESWLHHRFLTCEIDGIGGVIRGFLLDIIGRLVLDILIFLRSSNADSSNTGLIGILTVFS